MIANSRYLLLRGRENIADTFRQRLENLLSGNRKIGDAYELKEQFREIYKTRDANGGIWRLIDWRRMASKSQINPLKRLAGNLSKNFNEVVNFFKYRVTSGSIESANACISRIKSKICGLFNIPYLFLKLRGRPFTSESDAGHRYAWEKLFY